MLVTSPSLPHRAKSILIVDDNDIMLDVLTKTSEMLGLKVFVADNGLDGWDLFVSEQTDIVLTDIRKPGIDGIELSRRIRGVSPGTVIALMTGNPTGHAKDLLKDGALQRYLLLLSDFT